jgi:hypothetical protein
MWRYILIVGSWFWAGRRLDRDVHRFKLVGYGLFAASLACFGINSLLSRRDERLETRPGQIGSPTSKRWQTTYPSRISDPDILALADYHDAPGRAAVLASLRALPAGSRSLLTAARIVDPEPYLD